MNDPITSTLAEKQDNKLRTKAIDVQQLHAITIPVTSVQHTCAPYKMVDTLLPCLHGMRHAGTMNFEYYILALHTCMKHSRTGRSACMHAVIGTQAAMVEDSD